MKSKELFAGLIKDLQALPDIEIKAVTDRHEDIDGETCFVITRGVVRDKRYEIEIAKNKRPAILVSEEEVEADFPIVRVENARETLARLLYRLYQIDLSHVQLIGITGTNGKTTTASMLTRILREDGNTVGMIGTGQILINDKNITPKGYTMTTPDPTLLYPTLAKMIEARCRYIVMEVSSHALALSKVAPLTFSISIFTNLGEDHMDFHKNQKEYLEAKRKLFLQSKCAVLGTDDEAARSLIGVCQKTVCVGALYGAEAEIFDIDDAGLSGISFLYRYEGALQRFHFPFGGMHNVTNAALAITAAKMLGVRLCIAKEALEHIKIRGRMEKILDAPIVIIDYAHTPQAMKTVLKTARTGLNLGQRVFCLFGCGGERDRAKRAVMAQIAESYADLCVVTEDNSRNEDTVQIFRDILSGFQGDRHICIKDRQRAIEYLIDLAEPVDIILLFGKGHETYILRGNESVEFDERKIVHAAQKKKKEGHTKQYEN